MKLSRKTSGFSLVMVMTLGATVIIFSMALLSTLLQLQSSSSKNLLGEQCLHDANLGINYALAKCSQMAFTGVAENLPANTNLPPGLVNRIASLQVSLNPQKTAGTIIAVARNGTMTRQIIADIELTSISKAQIDQMLQAYNAMSPRAKQQQMFESGIQALNVQNVGDMKFVGQPSNSPYLVTNSPLNLSNMSNASIPGTLTVNNADALNTPTLLLPTNSTIGGDINFSGKPNSVIDTQTNSTFNFRSDGGSGAEFPPSANPNVLGNGSPDAQGGIINYDYYNPSSLATAPTLQSDSFAIQSSPLGSKSLSIAPASTSSANSASNIGNVSLPQYGADGQISLNSLSLQPSTYISSGVNIDANSTLFIDASKAQNNSLTTLNLQNVSDTSSAFNFNGNFGSNSQSAFLQIIYNGSKPININLSNLNNPTSTFSAYVYAPNATVNLNLANKTFKGAIVANNLDFQSSKGKFDYDPSNLPTQNGTPNAANAEHFVDNGAPVDAGLPFGKYVITRWREQH